MDQLRLHPPHLRLGAVPLGEVGHGADGANRAPALVADDEAAVEYVGDAAVVALEAVGGGPARRAAVDRLAEAFQHGRPVVRMDAVPPPRGRGRAERGFGAAEDAARILAPAH